MDHLEKVILLCGYRRTGKDTFFVKLSDNKQDNLFLWKIYKDPTSSRNTFDSSLKYIRTAFADSLKQDEVPAIYGIPTFVSDLDKDLKQFIHYKTGELVSARDIYIEWGTIRRASDPDYWCKAAFKRPSLEETVDSSTCCVVTDWRFHNEATYMLNTYNDVLTVRLYRSDIPEPDVTIESEHSLDNYRTDFLLLRDNMEGEYEKVIEKFPQYAGYVSCGTI